jgi:hypothetical protein
MIKNFHFSDKILYLLTFLLGFIVFTCIYGLEIVKPCNTEWLIGGDLEQHNIGWQAFRRDPWFFPLGMFNSLTYPYPVSIIYTDSIPLVASFFKMLSPILPEHFQYFGLWGLLCILLQSFLGAKILKRFCKNNSIVLIGSLFFTLSPVLFFRLFGHEALAGQWLILWAISEFIWRSEKPKTFLQNCVLWCIMGFLVIGIHLYFLPMVAIFLCGCVAWDILQEKNYKSLLYPIIYCISAIVMILIMGGFSHFGATFDDDGLTIFTFNLNGFVNPIGTSRFLHNLPYGQWQHEGFGYLGLGMILFSLFSFIVVVYSLFKKKTQPFQSRNRWYYIISMCLAAIFFILACSPRIMFGKGTIINYINILPQKVVDFWSIFRSTGRFIWSVVYLIFIANIFITNKFFSPKNSLIIISLFVTIQIVDLSSYLNRRKETTFTTPNEYITFNDGVMNKVGESGSFKHLVFDSSTHFTSKEYYSFAEYALKYNLTMNYFWLVHNTGEIEPFTSVENDCIYIFDGRDSINHKTNPKLLYFNEGDYIIGISQELNTINNEL